MRRTRALGLLRAVTTPLLPGDYLALVDPLLAPGLRARVEQVRPEAAGAVTLVLRPGPGWSGHRAGQWVRVTVEVDGVLHSRSYSLTAPPRRDGLISITVKPEAGGTVSPHLAGRVGAGDVLRLEQAAGDFALPAVLPERLLFLSAGSGITPVMGMLRELAAAGTLADVVLVHSAPTADDVIFGAELRALAAAHPGFRLHEQHTDSAGRLTPADLAALVPDWADREAWACGPAGLLDALEGHWESTGRRTALHTERFAARVLAGAPGAGGTVTLARSGTTGDAAAGTTLLDAGEAAGGLLPSGCRMGICFGCVVPLLSGAVRDVRSGDVSGEPGDLIQTCISAPVGPVVLDA